MISSESFSKTGVINMKPRHGLLVIVAVAMVFLGSCIGKLPLVGLSLQDLNREPGEPILMIASSINFTPTTSFQWTARVESPKGSGSWTSINSRLFTRGSNQSEAVLYLPAYPLPIDSTVEVRVSISHEGTTVTRTKRIDYKQTPNVLMEVFEKQVSFTTPDTWFRTSGVLSTARTPAYFRYIEGYSPSIIIVPEHPIDERFAWGVEPTSIQEIHSGGTLYVHAKDIIDPPTTSGVISSAFSGVDLDHPVQNWKIDLVADTTSTAPGQWRVTRWRADIYGQITSNTEVYLVRARKSDFAVTHVENLSHMLPLNEMTEDFEPEAIIVTELDISESALGIGPLWNNNYYFGIVIIDYVDAQLLGAEEYDPQIIIAVPVLRGAQMVFSPDVSH